MSLMDHQEDRRERSGLFSIFATDRLEDYAALSLAAFILIVVLLFF